MSRYLFVHFREKRTPDGEQVYFALSTDGFSWQAVNGGAPVLWAYYGDRGVRDCTIARCPGPEGDTFRILATDLSLAYGMRGKYHNDWDEISRHGSRQLALWESKDLVHWSEQQLVTVGTEDFGCVWAPDIIYDRSEGSFVVHWSSSHRDNGYGPKAIYYSRTSDFRTFTPPETLYRKEDCGVIDSALYEEDGTYYLFVKSECAPAHIILLSAPSPTGPFTRVPRFDRSMEGLADGVYEAPTAIRLADGSWGLFLDFYGVQGAGQGYVPFVAPSLASGAFVRADRRFSFPYGFKHGTILPITDEEYERIQTFAHWDLYE